MADTIRTQAALLALFADNTTGQISPQDARDLIVTSFTLQGVEVDTTSPTNGQYLVYNSSNTRWEPKTISVSGSPGGSDTQIQFNDSGSFEGDSGFTTDGAGSVSITGDLDVDDININGNTIISTNTDGDINLTPNGTGTVVVTGDLDVDNININGNTIISTDVDGDINLTPNGDGAIVLDGLSWPTADGTGGFSLKTDGAGGLYFDSVAGGSGGTVQGTDGTYDLQATNDGSIDGNARGEYSIDLQTERDDATQVAGGANAVLIGGQHNTASGDFSAIIGGSRGVALHHGSIVQSSGMIASEGDAQTIQLISRLQTTNATLSEMFIDGSSERMGIPDDTTWFFNLYIVARRTDANDESAAYVVSGCIDRNSGVGTTALVGSTSEIIFAEDDVDWLVTVDADTTNGSLRIRVQGEASKTINWVSYNKIIQVTG